MKRRDPSFDTAHLEQLCKVLGDTDHGLSGTEIGRILALRAIADPTPTDTKWKRLFAALAARQAHDNCGNCVMAFIHEAMRPVRYTGDGQSSYAWRLERLNAVLAFSGLCVREDGRFGRLAAAETLAEAEQRANRLRYELDRRGVHADVIRFCATEYLQENCFHAVFEATKSVADKIRTRAHLTGDGAQLVDQAFSGSPPLLAINDLRTETEQGEQRGFTNLLKGLFGTFRNVTAHAPKITWPIDEVDALDLFSLASYAHRRIDRSRSGLARS